MLRKRCNLDRRHLDDRIRAGGNTDLRLLQSTSILQSIIDSLTTGSN